MRQTHLANRIIYAPNTEPHTMKMNRMTKMTKALLLATLILGGSWVSQAQDIPAAINYQGRLTDNQGNTLTNGYYEIEFRIWDDTTSTAPASFVWGRSFPLHVVEGGLFNILLSNDGGEITSPGTPQFNDLREAFGGEDRYLGLTITVDPSGNVSSPTEISPRQQLASAAYAIQAQTANNVKNLGVTTSALANGSVTGSKIAVNAVTSSTIATNSVSAAKIQNNAVTTTKIASSAVTTAKIGNNQVTSEKLKINADYHLNDHTLLLGTDTTSGLKHNTTNTAFGGWGRDGALLFGSEGGMLGATSGISNRVVLSWSVDAVGIEQRLDAYGAMVNLSGHVNKKTLTPQFTAHADGTMMFYGRRGSADLQVWVNGTKLFAETSTIKGMTFYYDGDSNDGRSVMWPIRRGDKFQWNIRGYDTSSSHNPINNYLYFLPLGKNQGSASVSPN